MEVRSAVKIYRPGLKREEKKKKKKSSPEHCTMIKGKLTSKRKRMAFGGNRATERGKWRKKRKRRALGHYVLRNIRNLKRNQSFENAPQTGGKGFGVEKTGGPSGTTTLEETLR